MSGYIGPQPVPQATQTREAFTATSGQTTFNTGGYTAGYIDVFLNGVKLAAADYTATNGSDVVLATGAATGDILETVAYTTFTVADQDFTGTTTAEDLTVTGAFTSQGIDDNATSTAMTLDSSGNLLVGTTDTNPANDASGTGAAIGGAGWFAAARDGDTSGMFNRLTSDGDIVSFHKDGSTVGAVGSQGGDSLTIGNGDTGLLITGNNDAIHPWNTSTNASRDGAIDLGRSSHRFKDLYLSGGVYLGGTGSANKLDDYEEGTFTPVFTNGTYTYVTQTGRYTIVGNLISVGILVKWSASSSNGDTLSIDLPFTAGATSDSRFCGSLGYLNGVDTQSSHKQITAPVSGGSTYISFFHINDNGAPNTLTDSSLSASGEIQVSVVYEI